MTSSVVGTSPRGPGTTKRLMYAAFEGAPGQGRDDHTLNGPIAVRGAELGDTVEIRIRSIDLWLPIAAINIAANRGTLPEEFPYTRHRVVRLNLERTTTICYPELACTCRFTLPVP